MTSKRTKPWPEMSLAINSANPVITPATRPVHEMISASRINDWIRMIAAMSPRFDGI